VIIAKLDRLTRSVKDLAELLERFNRSGVSLVSVAESLDTGTAAGRLVLNIMTAVSQWEREASGERTRDAMHHKRANGERVGTVACPHGGVLFFSKLFENCSDWERTFVRRVVNGVDNAGRPVRSYWHHELPTLMLLGTIRKD
jgi:hypothetical protein